MGIRSSWGWDWATAKDARKDTRIETANFCRVLTRSPRKYFRANPVHHGRCAALLRIDLESGRQRCKAVLGKPVRECLRSARRGHGAESPLDHCSHRIRQLPRESQQKDCLFECVAPRCRYHWRQEWSIAIASRAQYLL